MKKSNKLESVKKEIFSQTKLNESLVRGGNGEPTYCQQKFSKILVLDNLGV